jgi:hypothetical protein
MKRPPSYFDGSWLEFYQEFIGPNLPPIAAVSQCHDWMNLYAEDGRRVVGSPKNRRTIFETNDRTQIIFADNSPAWVLPALLADRQITSYSQFADVMKRIPCHVFDIPRHLNTMNKCGWYVAHIYPAKNRDTAWQSWSRAEVERRFFLTLHPCNIFPAPNRDLGESIEVISFIAERYAERYGEVWNGFVKKIGRDIRQARPDFGGRPVYVGNQSALPVIRRHPVMKSERGNPRVSYEATRLLFKRDEIEPLEPDDAFEIRIRSDGIYRFTKRQFHEVFDNVVMSRSYRTVGNYHYTSVPGKAKPFRVG